MTDLIVQRTLDVGYVLKILTDKDIFDSISEDGMTVDKLNIDVVKDYWIELIDGDLEIGVFQLKQVFNQCWDAHIHVLPEYRKQYTEDAGHKIMEWMKENINGALIYTNVPVFCGNVRGFLLRFGFKETGYLEKAWLKNGQLNDMWIMCRRAE